MTREILVSGFVTFKIEQEKGREATLRAPQPTQSVYAAGDVFAAWPVQFGGGPTPDDRSELFFRQNGKFPGTNIVRLELISEQEYDRSKSTRPVARFKPYKDFIAAAREAANSA